MVIIRPCARLALFCALASAAITVPSVVAAEATSHLAVTVTVVASCVVRTTGDATSPVMVSCGKGVAARPVISETLATENPDILVSTINF